MKPEEKQLHNAVMLVRSYEGTIAHKKSRKEDVKEFEALLVTAKADVTRLEKEIKAEKVERKEKPKE